MKATRFIAYVCAALAVAPAVFADDYYYAADKGYIASLFPTTGGLYAAGSRGSDIQLVRDGALTPVMKRPGAGMYVTVSADGNLLGFKSIDGDGNQAPALYDTRNGSITLLEPYSNQCGQVSFADDGTMAYTVGDSLVVRDGKGKRYIDLGRYVNIASLSPDASAVAFTDLGGDIHIVDLPTGAIRDIADEGACRAQWSPDGHRLLVRRVNSQAVTVDVRDGTKHCLGDVDDIAWSRQDPDRVIVTRTRWDQPSRIYGSEVLSMAYDRRDSVALVPITRSRPMTAAENGGRILVAYSRGAARGIRELSLDSIAPYDFADTVRRDEYAAPGRVIAAIADSVVISPFVSTAFHGLDRPYGWGITDSEAGAQQKAIKDARTAARGTRRAPNSIGLREIPYINQVWDTPPVDGKVAYGHVCCGPSSSCMLLGWMGLLPEHPIRSRFPGSADRIVDYSWYVSKEYESPQTGVVFADSVESQGSKWVRGAHGYMWMTGTPNSRMPSFHEKNGTGRSVIASGWKNLEEQTAANIPYIVCLANGTGGHIVIAFRANQIASLDGSMTWNKKGSFVCHDPYGDYNDRSYPNWDGRYASYDWPGMNNGKRNITIFHWGCTTELPAGR